MRFGYVLLGLAALTSIHTSSGQEFSNGLAGVQSDEICCDADCGTCGGNTCGQQPGGAYSCCTSRIRGSGMMCSDTQAAPCIVDNDSECSNGLQGVQSGDICCDADCGTCGGDRCGKQPGGAESCCTSRIRDSGVMCSDTQSAPCIVDNDGVCNNGLPGVQSGDICCDPDCGTCGGSDCGQQPGGSSLCCTSRIRDSGIMCSDTSEAPCIIDDEVVCSNGVHGVEQDGSCCAAECGTCGESGCGQRSRGQDSCCTSQIQESGILCSENPVVPCIVFDDNDDFDDDC